MEIELVRELRKYTGQPIAECKRVIESVKPELAERYVEFYKDGKHRYFIDPQELDPELSEIFEKVDREAKSYLDGWKKERREKLKESEMEFMGLRGGCHVLWAEKKRILNQKYGINWLSPAQMNPGIVFD